MLYTCSWYIVSYFVNCHCVWLIFVLCVCHFSKIMMVTRPHCVNPVRRKSIPWKRSRSKADRSTGRASGARNVSAFWEWTRLHGITTVCTVCHISSGCSYPKGITTRDLVVISTKRNGKTDTCSQLSKSPPSPSTR